MTPIKLCLISSIAYGCLLYTRALVTQKNVAAAMQFSR